PGEALALKWSDISGDTLHVQRVLVGIKGGYAVAEQKAKTNKSLRPVTLSASVIAALGEHRQRQLVEILERGERYERNNFVFATEAGEFLRPDSVRSNWKRALARAGLPQVRLYDTRHSHATALLNQGAVNLAWVSARLGHTSVQTTEAVYARV